MSQKFSFSSFTFASVSLSLWRGVSSEKLVRPVRLVGFPAAACAADAECLAGRITRGVEIKSHVNRPMEKMKQKTCDRR